MTLSVLVMELPLLLIVIYGLKLIIVLPRQPVRFIQ